MIVAKRIIDPLYRRTDAEWLRPVFLSDLADALVLGVKQEVERELAEDVEGLRPEEALVLAFLQQRFAKEAAAIRAEAA